MLDREWVRHAVVVWFAAHERPLPWRRPGTTPWGILVSEIMSQQTPVARVEEPWRQWLARWPTPAGLAAADSAEVLRAWGRLGYPRRALRLAETARILAEEHGNRVPDDEEALLALPGIGRYTAAAVMAFAFGRRSLVLDTNIRRVLARLDGGSEFAPAAETAGERARASAWLPQDDRECAQWSVAVMELGALVCLARSPRCGDCPVASQCAWLAAGRPAWEGPARVAQAWAGTDRQCRGRIMAVLRASDRLVRACDISWPDRDQVSRCADALVADGLAHRDGDGLRLGIG
ncbi:MAG: A/G-specific adenine glycosylase [Propionibacteriaceae bacterium]|nr:A/G-specific adenine glycosylase [Propionibacteriaceae bacterium]